MALVCTLASLLRRDVVRRSYLNLILFLCGGWRSSVLDSQGLMTFAVQFLGLLIIVMISPLIGARSDEGMRARVRVVA